MRAAQIELTRHALIGAVLTFLANQDASTLRDVRETLEHEIDRAGPEAMLALEAHLRADHGWTYHAPDLLARRLHHVLADRFLMAGSELRGAQHVTTIADAPVVLVANHLSYADANVIQVLLHRGGAASLAHRLTALAGPKIFTSRQRRFSSLCFGTVKVPQSTDVASEEAVLSPREVARAARQSIETALARLRAGDALVLFGEGTRSRTGEMQPMLAATARYFDGPDTWVLPAGLTGSEALFPVDSSAVQPARAVLHLGRPVRASALVAAADRDRRLIMDAVGLAVAALVPMSYRGVYREPSRFPEARSLADAVGLVEPLGRAPRG